MNNYLNPKRSVSLTAESVLRGLRDLKPEEAAVFLFLTMHTFKLDSKDAKVVSAEKRFAASFIASGMNISESKARRILVNLITKRYITKLNVDRRIGNKFLIQNPWGDTSNQLNGPSLTLSQSSTNGHLPSTGSHLSVTGADNNIHIHNSRYINSSSSSREAATTTTTSTTLNDDLNIQVGELFNHYGNKLNAKHGIRAYGKGKIRHYCETLIKRYGLEKAKGVITAYLTEKEDRYIIEHAYPLGLLINSLQKYHAKAVKMGLFK